MLLAHLLLLLFFLMDWLVVIGAFGDVCISFICAFGCLSFLFGCFFLL